MADTQISIAEYMLQKKWLVDQKIERKRYMHRLARNSRQDPDIASKIGGMLIYNQLIEQYLSDIVYTSIQYIKAEMWPVSASLEVELDKSTFGKIIDYFQEFAIIEDSRAQILAHLKRFNTKRNQVVHDLFDIPDLHQLGRELDDYARLADEILRLLEDYDRQIDTRFQQLAQRVNFRQYRNT